MLNLVYIKQPLSLTVLRGKCRGIVGITLCKSQKYELMQTFVMVCHKPKFGTKLKTLYEALQSFCHTMAWVISQQPFHADALVLS
jgi:hypothetical protein